MEGLNDVANAIIAIVRHAEREIGTQMQQVASPDGIWLANLDASGKAGQRLGYVVGHQLLL